VIALGVLERFTRPRARARDGCELCAAPLADDHRHVVDVEQRLVLCACAACTLLFVSSAAARGRFRAVPDRVLSDAAFELTETHWASLDIPVRLAFLFQSSAAGRWVAAYPSPAGATESALPLDAWERIASRAPLVRAVAPDVEALLVYGRRGASSFECFLAPIDVCYDLVGRVRRNWRGLDGGQGVWTAIEDSLTRLRRRSRPLREGARPPETAAP
jgi:hypothetical protein